MVDSVVQTGPVQVTRPKLRIKTKFCTDDIKTACVNLYSNCNLSVEKSRVAVQIVCKYLYKHDMYLSAPNTELNSQKKELPTKRLCKEPMKD